MARDRIHFLFLNIGHFLDHLLTLVFATVAALALSREWSLGYGDLLTYATPGFVAFGLFSLPAGWLADKWIGSAGRIVVPVLLIAAGVALYVTSTTGDHGQVPPPPSRPSSPTEPPQPPVQQPPSEDDLRRNP